MDAIYKLLREVEVLPPRRRCCPRCWTRCGRADDLEEVGELIALDPVADGQAAALLQQHFFQRPRAGDQRAGSHRPGRFSDHFFPARGGHRRRILPVPPRRQPGRQAALETQPDRGLRLKFVAGNWPASKATCCSPPACCTTSARSFSSGRTAKPTACCGCAPCRPARRRSRREIANYGFSHADVGAWPAGKVETARTAGGRRAVSSPPVRQPARPKNAACACLGNSLAHGSGTARGHHRPT